MVVVKDTFSSWLDILVNNVGVLLFKLAAEYMAEVYARVMATNNLLPITFVNKVCHTGNGHC